MPTGTVLPPQDDIAGLIGRVATGDREAFARLYRETSAKLFSVTLSILRERALAEEALQDAFTNVWRSADTFDPDRARGMTWLIVVARNRALTLRRRGGREIPVDPASLPMEVPDPAPGPLENAERAAATRALLRCMEGLREEYREAIRLAYFRGLTRDELARELGVPAGTAKSWVRRGLMQLRRCLDDGA